MQDAKNFIRKLIIIALFFPGTLFASSSKPVYSYFLPDNYMTDFKGWYTTLKEGITLREDEPHGNGTKSFNTGPVAGLAIGYIFNKFLRAEGEFAFRQQSINKLTDTIVADPISTTEQSLALMLNGFITPFTWDCLAPYLGAGLGYADIYYGIHTNLFPPPSFSHAYSTENRFAYQLMAGLDYAVADNLKVGLEYVYFRVNNILYPNNVNSRLIDHDILVNLTYLFNPCHQPKRYFDPFANVYFAMEDGFSWRSTIPYSTGTKSYQFGPAVGGAVGYDFVDKARIEGEFIYRQNTVDIIQLGLINQDRPTGDEIVSSFMANGYLSPFNWNNFIPYVGAGLGYARTTYAVHVFLAPQPPAFAHPRLVSSDFAYQGMAGLSYRFADNFMVGAEYRYFRVNNMDFQQVNGSLIHTHIAAHTGLLRFTCFL